MVPDFGIACFSRSSSTAAISGQDFCLIHQRVALMSYPSSIFSYSCGDHLSNGSMALLDYNHMNSR
jgi:hypothetical protein